MKKIIFLIALLSLMFSSVFAVQPPVYVDTVLDVTYDNDYMITTMGWAVNGSVYNPTSVSTPNFPSGFNCVMPGKDDSYAFGRILNNGAGAGLHAFWFQTANIQGNDSWFTYSATGLEVGKEYEIKTVIGSNSGTLKPSLGLHAWESTTSPDSIYIRSNALINELANSQPITNEMSKTFTATHTDMTVGIGVGMATTNSDSRYIYNMRVLIGSFSIIKKAPKYDITYHNVGTKNAAENPSTYTEAEGLVSLTNPNDSVGYVFEGWYTDAGLTSAVASPAIPTGETTPKEFYAKWSATAAYTVTYNANGGVDGSITSEIVNDGASPLLSGDPTRVGYTFTVWTDNMAGDGDTITTESIITSDSTVYAQWDFIPLLDTILDETYNSDYFTSIGWTGNGYADPAGSGLPNELEDGYDAFTDVGLNSGNILYYENQRLYTRGNFGNDVWITFDANGLEVGAEYKIIAQLTAQVSKITQVNERSSATLAAWESGSAPVVTGNYISLNDPLLPYTTFVEVGDTADMDTIITATANSMVFGIGVGGNTRAYHSQGLYINSWSIIKSEDPGVPTQLDNKQASTLSLYPNPANNVLNISGLEDNVSIELYNTAGSLIKTTMDRSIDVSDLSQGIYFIKAGQEVKQFAKQ